MSRDEFEKIWRLMASLWPNAAAKKSDVDKTVWFKSLEPYDMKQITERIMSYSRTNKFFPDVADITRMMLSRYGSYDDAIRKNVKAAARIAGVALPEFSTTEEARQWALNLFPEFKTGVAED